MNNTSIISKVHLRSKIFADSYLSGNGDSLCEPAKLPTLHEQQNIIKRVHHAARLWYNVQSQQPLAGWPFGTIFRIGN